MGQKASKRQSVAVAVAASNTSGEVDGSVAALIRGGRFAAASELPKEVVQQHQTQFGSDHPITLSSMFELGRVLHGDGRVEKALRVFQQLLPLQERVLGPAHTATLATLDAICEELCNLGKYQLSLANLVDQQQRCERACGLEHERTIQVLVDIAHVLKLIGESHEASSAFSMALDRSKRSLGETHDLTLAISHDLRGLEGSPPLNLEDMKALLRQNGLPVSVEPFADSVSATWQQSMARYELKIGLSFGYEASNIVPLRMGPINGERGPRPPVHIPPYHTDPTRVGLGPVLAHDYRDPSFLSLVNRSIGILPRGRSLAPHLQQAVEKHTAFLRSLSSLDELLTATETPVWFFQHRDSFMQQTTFQKWDPDALDRYVLLPLEGGLANREDCIFISHYWRAKAHPDPDGEDLQQLQQLLSQGFWSKSSLLWVDWTCLPQWERTASQQRYFSRVLQSIPKLVRECSFMPQLPEFRPRLWVLFEVAAFTFSRVDVVGLPSVDSFQRHLRQMGGDDVRLVLDRFGYACTNKADREWVISSLEILLGLRKTVPCIHTRRQILDTVDNSAVRSCIHQEAGVEVDKERGTLKANEITLQFNPLPVEEGIPGAVSAVHLPGDYEIRRRRAMEQAGNSLDISGIGELGREYDRAGDYKIAEALHRLALEAREDFVASQDLSATLENREQYEEAAALCQRDMGRPGASQKIHAKLVALQHKQGQLTRYRRWTLQPLEATVQMERQGGATRRTTQMVRPLVVRNGLRRSWLQRLDQSVWQCEDPVVMKSMEERGLRFEQQRRFEDALQIHWSLLGRRKELLGPCHVDTRRSLAQLARAFLLTGKVQDAHFLYTVALSVCDFTLGLSHPESRAVLGDLAAVTLRQGKQGVARSYYRQLLERTLAVAEWDDPEAFTPKFFLQALVREGELQIVHTHQAATVEILGPSPQQPGAPSSNSALAMLADDAASHRRQEETDTNVVERGQTERAQSRQVAIVDLETADVLMTRYRIARGNQ